MTLVAIINALVEGITASMHPKLTRFPRFYVEINIHNKLIVIKTKN